MMPNDPAVKKTPLLPVDDARDAILRTLPKTAVKTLPIAQSLGYRLAADLSARLTLPPQAVSAMDGYAVRQQDVTTFPAELTRVAESAAGHPWTGHVGAGEAVRIFTGAALPRGADTIVIQEDVDPAPEENGTKIIVRDAEPPGRYIRPAGLDVAAGDTILKAGTLMAARAIGLAVAAGLTEAVVHQRPRIGILSTGDELVLPGQTPGPGQIISSNASFLKAFVTGCGATPIDLGVARDRPGAMVDAVRAGGELDLVVTTGGASVGTHDHIISDLESAKAAGQRGVNFWKIAMRPGKPLISGHIGDIPLIGLPGNPVSTAVCAFVFLAPAIAYMSGGTVTQPIFTAILEGEMAENDQRQDYIRARLHPGPAGMCVVPASRQDSSMMSVLANADALIVRPPFDPARKSGDSVSVIPIQTLF
jgi:molybdopterin molybdotransferase